MTQINRVTLLLHSLPVGAESLKHPDKFTFPYYYKPHPLALLAIDKMQTFIKHSVSKQYDFSKQGLMFAVLVVKDKDQHLHYLCSYESKSVLFSQDIQRHFVNNISPAPSEQKHLDELSVRLLNHKKEYAALHVHQQLTQTLQCMKQHQLHYEQALAELTNTNKQKKEKRTQIRANAELNLCGDKLASVLNNLARQSSQEKQQLKDFKLAFKKQAGELKQQYDYLVKQQTDEKLKIEQEAQNLHILTLKSTRIANQKKESISFYDLFKSDASLNTTASVLRACYHNLPKLLNQAFLSDLTPIALGEFWWGKTPAEQIRQHKNLYPVNQTQCYEALDFMLKHTATDPSPLEITPSLDVPLDIIYEDDAIVVVNKPAEFLSVSGKYIQDSVEHRIAQRYPHARGPLIVHRLDMSTSGLLVLTLTAQANKQLQKQFIERQVEKRYSALLQGLIESKQGIINLPLSGDLDDRPRQKVDHKTGRAAETTYKVIDCKDGQTLVHLYPKTGRTHQLRVHCAHSDGLNTPIVGDDLYGFKEERLHLHAGFLKFCHPVTNDVIEFFADDPF